MYYQISYEYLISRIQFNTNLRKHKIKITSKNNHSNKSDKLDQHYIYIKFKTPQLLQAVQKMTSRNDDVTT